MVEVILALDQGTTSSRAIVFDRSGHVLGIHHVPLTQHYPRPGWVEHDPDDIWQTQLEAAHRAIARAAVSPADIAAIGVTNQRETTVVWDRLTGEPVHPAIVWQDRRTSHLCNNLRVMGWNERIRHATGLVIDPYFSATKLLWLLDNVAGLRQRAVRGDVAFGTIDSFLIYRLTGGAHHVTDVSNASRTTLFNLHTLDWDDDILREFGIPRAMLPDVRSSSEFVGVTDRPIFGGEIPIAGIAGDQQAALFGQTCFNAGQTKQTYGTGAFALMNIGDRPVFSSNGLLTTVAWRINGAVTYALEGSIFATGATIQWLRDEMGVIDDAGQSEQLARSVASTGGVYLVPAFAGLGAPHWDQDARGVIVGLTRGSGRAELVRAALEATAFQTLEIVDIMGQDGGYDIRELRVDGGMVRNGFLMQLQADLLSRPVIRPVVTETTALGAAYLAGLAIGYWPSQAEIAKNWKIDERFDPSMNEIERQHAVRQWNKAVERAKGWAPGARDDVA